jgi:segregation and condensation protein B
MHRSHEEEPGKILDEMQDPDAAPAAAAAEPSAPERPELVDDEALADPGPAHAGAGEAPATAPAPIEAPVEHRLELILEALLLAADQPLSLEQLQRLVGSEFNLSRRELREALEHLQARYTDSACELHEVASGWRLQVRAEFGQWVGRLWQEKPPRYSRALLETLALVVYRQPITRGEIEDVRGVTVSTNILRTLLERGWVREVGHKEVPGRPALYGTTPQFLDDFNLKSLDQLPTLPQIKDLEQIEAALARVGQALAQAAPAEAGEVAADSEDEAGAAPPETGHGAVPPDTVVH